MQEEIRRRTRRSFLAGGVAAVAAGGLFNWIKTRPQVDGIPGPLRRVEEWNSRLESHTRLAPTYPRGRAAMPSVNGTIGLDGDPSADWRLEVEGEQVRWSLADLQALPHTEVITELKCVEGWSTVVQWGGCSVADFLAHSPGRQRRYLAAATPDREYYVGLDMESALHPQTLLCYEMNGQPLTAQHGAPARLVVPIKYGIKSLKRLGWLSCTDTRPPDYWAERGYDWHSGF